MAIYITECDTFTKQSFEDRSDSRAKSSGVELDEVDPEMENRFLDVLQNIHGRIGVLGGIV